MLDKLVNEPFLGFQKEALKFLKDLQNPKKNNKEWFDTHRDIYENFLKDPMKKLIDTLAIEINKIDPDIVVGSKSIFRINRDIRFSKVKTPYKTHYSAAFAFGRIKSAEIPQFYFHFEPKEFIVAGGQYSSDINYLKKIRSHIFKNFAEYKKITKNKSFVKEYKEVDGISLERLPKGYDNLDIKKTDPLLVKTLKMRQFFVHKIYKPEVILNEKIVDLIVKNIKLMYDFMRFLHVATK